MRLRTFILLIFLVSLTRTGISQTNTDFINGTLRDKVTKSKIEFASVGIMNTTLGTAADDNGEFILRIENQYKEENLKISCIGYLTKTLSIDSLLSLNQKYHTIYLTPDIALLDEVVVKEAPVNPADIVRLAVTSIGKNYLQRPFNLELLSIIHADDSIAGKKYKVESILVGYYQGYYPKGKKKFEIIQKRTTGEDPLKTINYGYWPSFEIGSADLLTDQFKRGIFNLDLLDDFRFKYAGVSIYENDTVYNIEYYAPRPTTKITGYGIVPKTYRGNIYITTSTNAVVRHEIITSSFTYHVIYKKLNDRYFPYYFSGLRINEFKLPGGKREFRTYNTVTVTKIILHDVKVIDDKANDFDVNKVRYDERFWNEYYPIERR
ncbi:MAG: carboxypeptidase-like regulatory domain-containing protein [Cytophagales bacterium]|jgi:hypothetical protein|nr:carboxypeptidase-like regulatory domain-containing protein [Cytophagales bacterium]